MLSQTPGPMDLAELVRRATIPAVDLLAETRSALLLVDVQNRFIFGPVEGAPPAPTARVIPPIAKLLATARSRGVPRFYVSASHMTGPSDAAPWMRRLAAMGADVKGRLTQPPLSAWASEIPNAIAPQPGDVHIRKWRFSAFYETALDVLLRGSAIETLVLGGVASYGCIIATYIDACSRGFFPLVCAEAVDGVEPTQHRAAMDFMSPAHRLSLEEVLRVWNDKT
ncbi:MAG: cysteine hydrolase [Alphaproteobacteria bacterium]|nr:cysteine hydrolase [Alphaproteobacteria bacterium]